MLRDSQPPTHCPQLHSWSGWNIFTASSFSGASRNRNPRLSNHAWLPVTWTAVRPAGKTKEMQSAALQVSKKRE